MALPNESKISIATFETIIKEEISPPEARPSIWRKLTTTNPDKCASRSLKYALTRILPPLQKPKLYPQIETLLLPGDSPLSQGIILQRKTVLEPGWEIHGWKLRLRELSALRNTRDDFWHLQECNRLLGLAKLLLEVTECYNYGQYPKVRKAETRLKMAMDRVKRRDWKQICPMEWHIDMQGAIRDLARVFRKTDKQMTIDMDGSNIDQEKWDKSDEKWADYWHAVVVAYEGSGLNGLYLETWSDARKRALYFQKYDTAYFAGRKWVQI
ncbi:hypothetical protein BJ508DRAFT_338604 [Ascobolus immersus RN42]|uniref:Uncharacterized protein n=1 Tax=Ascobolus immersus RN42 TaxID=1160509 RepID=A0A3N4HQW0_ASCIM|nr:hypothetical protein BJ508DRAFT_338604 [Ascobolus immersus RN42]